MSGVPSGAGGVTIFIYLFIFRMIVIGTRIAYPSLVIDFFYPYLIT